MLTAHVSLRLETDLIQDAVDDLSRIHEALAYKHGERYRDYERRLEALMKTEVSTAEFKPIGPGWLVAIPPVEFTKMIAEAQNLGIIP